MDDDTTSAAWDQAEQEEQQQMHAMAQLLGECDPLLDRITALIGDSWNDHE
jgi:hypothetical protein